MPAAAGNRPRRTSGNTEPAPFSGDAQVAGEGEFEAPAERQPLDGGDARLRELGQPPEAVAERADEPGEVVGAVEPVELGDVGSGGERPVALPGHDDHPYGRVGVDRVERLVEDGDRVGPDGVQPSGAVERQDGDSVIDLQTEDGRLAHTIVRPPLTERVWPVI